MTRKLLAAIVRLDLMGIDRQKAQGRNTVRASVIGGVIVLLVMLLTTLWTGRSAQHSTEQAVHSISTFYLQELAGRREQVVATNLRHTIEDMHDALDLLSESDLADMEHLQAFQARMNGDHVVFIRDCNGILIELIEAAGAAVHGESET